MNRRDSKDANTPPPKYDSNSPFFTLCINYGGKIDNGKESAYIGGNKVALDYVHKDVFTLHILESFIRNEGVNRPIKLYSHRGDGFILMDDNADLAKMYESKTESGRLVELYVDEIEESVVTKKLIECETSNGYVLNEENGGESDDFDYYVDGVNCVDHDLDDDRLFSENVDPDAEGIAAIPLSKCVNPGKSEVVEGIDCDECNEKDIVKSEVVSNSERKENTFPVFSTSQLYDPTFVLGMRFTTKELLRKAIHSFAINTQRSIKIVKNDKMRVHAKCADKECKWALHGLNVPGESTYQIRLFNATHTCEKSFKVRNMNSSWIAGKYLHQFQSDPKRKIKDFRFDAIHETKCDISPNQAYRAKRQAIDAIKEVSPITIKTMEDEAEDELSPKVKKRSRSKPQVLSNPHRLKRQQTTVACGLCGVKGHNKRYCTRVNSTEDNQLVVTTETDPLEQQQDKQEEIIVSQSIVCHASDCGANSSNQFQSDTELDSPNRLTRLKVKRESCQYPPTPSFATRQSTKSCQTMLRSGKCFKALPKPFAQL